MIVMPPNAVLAKPRFSSLRRGLIAYWRAEEASGSRADATGRGNTLTDNNTVTQQSPGKQGDAALFTRANSESLTRASTGDMDFRNKSITFNAWCKLVTNPALMQIMGTGIYGVGPVMMLYSDVGVYRFLLSYNGSAVVQASGGTPDTTTAHMLTGTIKRNSATDLKLRLYVDGTQVDIEYTGANDLGADVTGTFAVGARPDLTTYFMDGWLDELSIHEYALTDAQVKMLYAAGNGARFPWVGIP